MEIQRIRVTLNGPEYTALVRLAGIEMRPLDYQAGYILRKELERRGFLQGEDAPEAPTDSEASPCQE